MRKYLPPLILFFLLLIGWQALALGINAAYILPTPIQVIQKLWELREPLFMVHLPATMSVTFIGLGISVVLGLALAIAMDMLNQIASRIDSGELIVRKREERLHGTESNRKTD